MTKAKKIKCAKDTPPLATILAAMQEDTQAMDELISFYQPYIRTLATKELYDAAGGTYTVVDEQVRRQLEIKLIASILKFQIR